MSARRGYLVTHFFEPQRHKATAKVQLFSKLTKLFFKKI